MASTPISSKHSRSSSGFSLESFNDESPPTKKVNVDDVELSCKVFNDPVHGHIKLHPLLVKIIDTPQFQRLRNILQLGGCYFVYPGAAHNRFEHSIGVAYLAGKFVTKLWTGQKNLDELLDDEGKDRLCVEIAGLCHDLGHGPFSHLWDYRFMRGKMSVEWEHEQGSIDMLDHLIEVNGLTEEFEKYELTKKDILFIKELIKPKEPNGTSWEYKGREKEKSFLYEIVSNKRNGVDVDKWDYFKRDCHHLGIPCSFNIERAMEFARVIEVEGQKQVCFRDKEVVNMYQMFQTRLTLHRMAYQHKTANAVEIMLTEALALADPYVTFAGKNNEGPELKMSECIKDMQAYTKLTDHVIYHILASSDEKLEKSKKLLLRVQKRDLYKCIGQVRLSRSDSGTETKAAENIAKEITEASGSELTREDLYADEVKFDFGLEEYNPVDRIRFFSKNEPEKAEPLLRDCISMILPGRGQPFLEQIVRIYCTSVHKVDVAKRYFKEWCDNNPNYSTVYNYIVM